MHNTKAAIAAFLLFASPALAQSTFSQPTWTGIVTLPGQHTLVSLHTTVDAAAGIYVLAWDAPSAPAPGVLASAPGGCFYTGPVVSPARSETLGMANTPYPVVAQTGLVVGLSSTPCNVAGASYTPVAGYLSVTYQ